MVTVHIKIAAALTILLIDSNGNYTLILYFYGLDSSTLLNQ